MQASYSGVAPPNSGFYAGPPANRFAEVGAGFTVSENGNDLLFQSSLAQQGNVAALVPGSYPLSQALNGPCGSCMLLLIYAPNQSQPSRRLLATSGTEVVTQVNIPNLVFDGHVMDAGLVEVDSQGNLVPGGCATNVSVMDFDVKLTPL
jgi:hypothetical protein